MRFHSGELFDFGEALRRLKAGKAVSRINWNGKGMFVYLSAGAYDKDRDSKLYGVPLSLYDVGDTGIITRHPNLNLALPDGSTCTGWLASQLDMLAEDWGEIDPA